MIRPNASQLDHLDDMRELAECIALGECTCHIDEDRCPVCDDGPPCTVCGRRFGHDDGCSTQVEDVNAPERVEARRAMFVGFGWTR